MNPDTDSSARPAPLKSFRRLAWNELVKRGDYVEDGKSGFELWVGPSGFHADSFIKAIYRKYSPRTKAVLKPG
jgi:hypothetical protein